ncbi:hypothetical protein JCGZ_12035 [Jatropha curcas]|uniref:Uncharacterized protein n=1 Tax=Jatropha curcas TaxID=180498 RepID=A0A067KCN3_JATCU|nr:uncharacterized protein LOC105638878 [Jatropha curcas]KDP32743.1 hypothetical protein JCGZ_12035 [Jatropha curcas]
MAKVSKVKGKAGSQHHRMTPYPLPSRPRKNSKGCHSKKKHSKALEKNDWEGATCSVCLEYPHNAVLLLCSSYNKGCRPYMCATSSRYSNCLEQYKKAYTKVTSTDETQQLNRSVDNLSFNLGAGLANEKKEVPELLCPLCRGQVKGWTVVEPARKYLNGKKRTCMQEKCSFVGTYKQLRKHVKGKHPLARPRAVDPVLEEKWKKLECERERNDVISTIMSSTPGAVVLGDYVIEPGRHGIFNDYDYDSDESLDDGFFPLESFNRGQSSGRYHSGFHLDFDSLDEDDYGMRRSVATGPAALSGRGLHRLLLGRTRRNWRYRGGNRSRNL